MRTLTSATTAGRDATPPPDKSREACDVSQSTVVLQDADQAPSNSLVITAVHLG